MKRTKYPSPEEVVKLNEIALMEIKVKKADKPVLLSKSKIDGIIHKCKYTKGDIYDKAVCLIQAIIQEHPFASGNRRTASKEPPVRDGWDYVAIVTGGS